MNVRFTPTPEQIAAMSDTQLVNEFYSWARDSMEYAGCDEAVVLLQQELLQRLQQNG